MQEHLTGHVSPQAARKEIDVKRIPRHSEIRVTGLDGQTRIGQGDGLALAVRSLSQHDVDAELDERSAALQLRLDAIDDAKARGCRHCGGAVELGLDGAVLHARLGLDDTAEVPYVAHLVCQVRMLEQLAATSHEDIARWKLTVAGTIVLAADRTTAYIDAPTAEAAVAMEGAYRLAEQTE